MGVRYDPLEWVRLGIEVPTDYKCIGASNLDKGLKYYVTVSGYEILRGNFFDYIESDLVFSQSPEIWLSSQFNCSTLNEVDQVVRSLGKVSFLMRSPALDPPPRVEYLDREIIKEVTPPLVPLKDIVYIERVLPREYIHPSSASFDELWDILRHPETEEEMNYFVQRFFSTESKDNIIQTALYSAFVERLVMLCNHDLELFSEYIMRVLEG